MLVSLPCFIQGCLPLPEPDENATISVKLINKTDLELDPQLYRSANDLQASELFGDINNLEANFDGKTTIPAGTTVTLSLKYSETKTIGSSQAIFGSLADWTGGKSSDSPVLHQGDDFDSQDTITFRFLKDSDGNYHTTVTLE